MEEETQEVEETTDGVTPTSEGNTEETQEDDGIDYKAELEKERKRRERAEFALKERNIADKNRRDTTVDDEELSSTIEAKIEEKMNAFRASQNSEIVEESLDSVAKNTEERDLIRFHYENSVIHTGISRNAVKDDMQKAKLLANASKYQRENDELSETIKAKKSMGKGSSTNQDKPSYKPDISKAFTEVELKFMKNNGFTDEMMKKAATEKRANQ